MAESPRRSVDLSYLSTDVRNQIARSRDILTQVRALQATLPEIKESDARAKIEQTIKELLTVASSLAENATTTTANTVLTVVESTGKTP
ncbi:MAG TPA: hypothetical protein VLX44_14700 [Xanthobacteraceae bacterium]|nr:hypothetical protein [Xanthobacteraceae bacterium]